MAVSEVIQVENRINASRSDVLPGRKGEAAKSCRIFFKMPFSIPFFVLRYLEDTFNIMITRSNFLRRGLNVAALIISLDPSRVKQRRMEATRLNSILTAFKEGAPVSVLKSWNDHVGH